MPFALLPLMKSDVGVCQAPTPEEPLSPPGTLGVGGAGATGKTRGGGGCLRRVCWPFRRILGKKRSRREQEAEGDEEAAEGKTAFVGEWTSRCFRHAEASVKKDWKPAEAGSPGAPKLTRSVSLPTWLQFPIPAHKSQGAFSGDDAEGGEVATVKKTTTTQTMNMESGMAVTALASRLNDSTPHKKMDNSEAARSSSATSRTNFTATSRTVFVDLPDELKRAITVGSRAKGPKSGEGTFAKPSPPKKQKLNHLPQKTNGSSKESRSAWLEKCKQANSMATPKANIMGEKVPLRPKILSTGSCGFTGTSIKTNVEVGGKVE